MLSTLLHNYPRASSSKAKGLSHRNLIIIIAVSAAVATLLLAYILYRSTRFLRRQSNPLPPVQPLSHHREQRLAKFGTELPRSQSWYISATPAFSPASDTSLVGKEDHLSRHASTSISAENASSSSLVPQPFSPSEHGFTLPQTPQSPTPSDDKLTPPFARHPRLRTPSSSPSRPLSVASQYTTRSNRNTIRGMPHGPHSQVQIILPMPLGSGVARPSPRSSLYEMHDTDRRSFVDRWVPVGREHTRLSISFFFSYPCQ